MVFDYLKILKIFYNIRSSLVKQSNSKHDLNYFEKFVLSLPFFSPWKENMKILFGIFKLQSSSPSILLPLLLLLYLESFLLSSSFFMLRYGNMIYENTSEVRVNMKRHSNKHEKNDSMTIVNYRFFLFCSFHFRFFLLFFLLKFAIFGSYFSLFLSFERNKIMLYFLIPLFSLLLFINNKR